METIERIRNGAVRYKNADDCYVVANPGTIWYSTVVMLATEYYMHDKWMDIDSDEKVPYPTNKLFE